MLLLDIYSLLENVVAKTDQTIMWMARAGFGPNYDKTQKYIVEMGHPICQKIDCSVCH